MTLKYRLFPVVVGGRNRTENSAVKFGSNARIQVFAGARIAVFMATLLTIFCGLISRADAGNTYIYRGVCPYPNGGKRILDKWYEWECECTSYAADKLNERGVPFKARYKNVLWANAGSWLTAAQQSGTPYSTTPRSGDVAWFAYGHVAYVDAVDSYGNVSISEYNWGTPHNYHIRTVKKGTASYPNSFIHFP